MISVGGWGIYDDVRTMPSRTRPPEFENGFLKKELDQLHKKLDDSLNRQRGYFMVFHCALLVVGMGLAGWGFYQLSHESTAGGRGVDARDLPTHEICTVCGTKLTWWYQSDGLCASCKQKAGK